MDTNRVGLAPSLTLYRFQFRAMNTTIDCAFAGIAQETADKLERLARDWFEHIERIFSRFLPGSELSRLNRLAGRRCLVSATMLEVLKLAQMYIAETEGTFNPFIHRILVESGYDETFDRVRNRTVPLHIQSHLPNEPVVDAKEPYYLCDAQGILPRRMMIDPAMKAIELPAGCAIDLGGIVKSWAARRLAHYFRHKLGVRRGLINAGGDAEVWSDSPAEASPITPWRIAIEDPWDSGRPAGMLAITEGAAATSGTLGRKWQTGHGPMHHLINPFTMRPSESDVLQCTVSGDDAVTCEIWAKTICILGSRQGLSLFARKAVRCEALLFTAHKATCYCGDAVSIGERWRDVHIDSVHQVH